MRGPWEIQQIYYGSWQRHFQFSFYSSTLFSISFWRETHKLVNEEQSPISSGICPLSWFRLKSLHKFKCERSECKITWQLYTYHEQYMIIQRTMHISAMVENMSSQGYKWLNSNSLACQLDILSNQNSLMLWIHSSTVPHFKQSSLM